MRLIDTAIIISIGGLFLIPARANDLPDAPSNTPATTAANAAVGKGIPADRKSSSAHNRVVFNKKGYWPLVGALGTTAILDAQMSYNYEARHPTSTETSAWLLGKRPSLGRYYATFAVMDGGAALISYKLLHSRRKPLRIIGWSLLGGLTAIHTEDCVEMAAR